jgi:hypothetical protein
MSRSQLQEAYQLLKRGRKVQAEAILQPIVEEEPDNADAWWLLANALSDVDAKRDAAERVLRLRPDHAKARLMLQRLKKMDEIEDSLSDILEMPYVESSPEASGQRVVVTKPKGQNNTLLIVLAVFGVLGVICVVIAALGIFGSAMIFERVISDPEVASIIGELSEMTTYITLPETVDWRGAMEPGETVEGSASNGEPDGWTFNVSRGESYTIEADAASEDFDPIIYLYGPDGILVDSDDDGGDVGLDSRLVVELRESGTYSIIVGAVGGSGRYELRLRHGRSEI